MHGGEGDALHHTGGDASGKACKLSRFSCNPWRAKNASPGVIYSAYRDIARISDGQMRHHIVDELLHRWLLNTFEVITTLILKMNDLPESEGWNIASEGAGQTRL